MKAIESNFLNDTSSSSYESSEDVEKTVEGKF